jgi:hypothetical protein
LIHLIQILQMLLPHIYLDVDAVAAADLGK